MPRSKKPTFVLIDEPELNLHPSLQVDFLTTLGSYATRGVLFATHNLGLARAVADRIYSVQCSSEGSLVRDLERTPRMAEFLGELSYSSYQALGFDRILLVEGPSDLRIIQQFLRKHKKDHRIVMLQLAGSSGIHPNRALEISELKRISSNISAIIDSERDAPDATIAADRRGFRDVCETAGVQCHVLERRAIENYFSETAIKRALGASYQALTPFEALSDAANGWRKTEGWRIAKQMELSDLDGTDFGQFLQDV